MAIKDLIHKHQCISYIVLCYAINNKRSYDDLQDWVDVINSNPQGNRAHIALVATKSDLASDRKVEE